MPHRESQLPRPTLEQNDSATESDYLLVMNHHWPSSCWRQSLVIDVMGQNHVAEAHKNWLLYGPR